jgi:hypothetical protein
MIPDRDTLAALHALDPGPLHGILGPADWDGFLAGQRATAPERQPCPNASASSRPRSPAPGLAQIVCTVMAVDVVWSSLDEMAG